MKTNTLPTQLLAFFRQNAGQVFSGAEITRKLFPKYAYGQVKGYHSPKSISRRLQEMAEEGTLTVSYSHNLAYYTIGKRPGVFQVEFVEREGIRYARPVLTPTL